jgi:hypothetical protein
MQIKAALTGRRVPARSEFPRMSITTMLADPAETLAIGNAVVKIGVDLQVNHRVSAALLHQDAEGVLQAARGRGAKTLIHHVFGDVEREAWAIRDLVWEAGLADTEIDRRLSVLILACRGE